MIQIEITEEVESTLEMVDLLNPVATMVKDGFTSGHYPLWKLIEVDEEKLSD